MTALSPITSGLFLDHKEKAEEKRRKQRAQKALEDDKSSLKSRLRFVARGAWSADRS
jgi:hypothetical protein